MEYPNGAIETHNSDLTRGTVQASKSEHIWTIENFGDYRSTAPGQSILSPVFILGGDGDLQGRLSLYPCGSAENDEDYISLYLYLDSCRHNEIRAGLKCWLHREPSSRRGPNDEFVIARLVHTFKRGHGFGFPGFVRRSEVESPARGLLVDGKLVIHCVIDVSDKIRNGAGCSEIEESTLCTKQSLNGITVAEPKLVLKEDSEVEFSKEADELGAHLHSSSKTLMSKDKLNKLLDNEYSDVTLISNGSEFRAHRNILASASPVFSKIFNGDCLRKDAKSDSCRFTIDNVKTSVLLEMLRFIYTNEIKNWKLISGLLDAADKYELDDLKNACHEKLYAKMNVDNIFSILALADIYKIEALKKQAIGYISIYARYVIQTPGFDDFKKLGRLDLMSEIFCALAHLV